MSRQQSRETGPLLRAKLPICLCVCALWALPRPARGDSPVTYRVEVPHPAHQLIEVELRLTAELPLPVGMPLWSPGSYRAKHWARNLRPRASTTASGSPLEWVRSGSDTWRIERASAGGRGAPGPQPLILRYAVYAGTLADDASHLDDEHGHLCGPSVFLLVPAARSRPQGLELRPPPGWRVATPLDPRPGRPGSYLAKDYDELVDAPLEMGRFASATLTIGDTPISIAWHDARGRAFPQRLAREVRQIFSLHRRWMGPLPYPRYQLIIHTVESDDYRALEHARGSSLIVPQSVLDEPDDYTLLLYVIAHEHLHVWNGKRVRPAEHAVYDYLAPQPSRLLWWTEGATDYLARLTLLGIGHWSRERYLGFLAQEISRARATPQRLWKSLADAAYEVWWPPRDPDEPPVSYYAQGHVVALLLDLELRARSSGRSSLLAVLRELDRRAARQGGRLALGAAELRQALGEAAGQDLQPLLERWVERPGDLRPGATLAKLGLRLGQSRLPPRPDFGFEARREGAELQVTAVDRGGPAARAGLVAGDRIVAIDGRSPRAIWRALLLDPGPHQLRRSRRGALRELQLRTRLSRPEQLDLELAPSPDEVTALREAWLRAAP